MSWHFSFEREFPEPSTAYDYYWRWFEYHAKQRYESFKLFVVQLFLTPAAALAVFSARFEVSKSLTALLLIAIALALEAWICFLFYRIDRRNEKLVKLGEAGLIAFEKRAVRTNGLPTILLKDETDHPETSRFRSHNRLLKMLYQTGIWSFGSLSGYVFVLLIFKLATNWGCQIPYCAG